MSGYISSVEICIKFVPMHPMFQCFCFFLLVCFCSNGRQAMDFRLNIPNYILENPCIVRSNINWSFFILFNFILFKFLHACFHFLVRIFDGGFFFKIHRFKKKNFNGIKL